MSITAVIPICKERRRLKNKIDIGAGLDLACACAWLNMDESVSQIDPYCVDTKNAGRRHNKSYLMTLWLPNAGKVVAT